MGKILAFRRPDRHADMEEILRKFFTEERELENDEVRGWVEKDDDERKEAASSTSQTRGLPGHARRASSASHI